MMTKGQTIHQETNYTPRKGGYAISFAGTYASSNPYLNLPVGVPVKTEIIIKGLPENTQILPLVQVAFRNFGTPGAPYGEALLSIRNIACI